MANTDEPTEYMLTTVDNPFNPFTMFDQWLAYDIMMGYNSASFLDRVANFSNDLSEPDQALVIEKAIDEICKENVCGMWKKVSKTSAQELAPEQSV
jgi:hypothetical protein